MFVFAVKNLCKWYAISHFPSFSLADNYPVQQSEMCTNQGRFDCNNNDSVNPDKISALRAVKIRCWAWDEMLVVSNTEIVWNRFPGRSPRPGCLVRVIVSSSPHTPHSPPLLAAEVITAVSSQATAPPLLPLSSPDAWPGLGLWSSTQYQRRGHTQRKCLHFVVQANFFYPCFWCQRPLEAIGVLPWPILLSHTSHLTAAAHWNQLCFISGRAGLNLCQFEESQF